MSGAGLLVLLGLGIFGYGAWRSIRSFRSRSWPKVTGKVLDTSIEDYWIRYHQRFILVVNYEYTVDGNHYESDLWSFGQGNEFDSEQSAQAMAKSYHAGRSIDVYVDPRDPDNAVLQPGDWNSGIALVLIGAVVTVMALVLGWG